MGLLIPIKSEFARIAPIVGATFEDLSVPELQDFLQGFDFTTPLINLDPVITFDPNFDQGGAVRYNVKFDLYFLTKFAKSDTLEGNKDILIDSMIDLQENFFRELNLNDKQIFIQPFWQWSSTVLRQYLSNLTVGVKSEIRLDTACNKV